MQPNIPSTFNNLLTIYIQDHIPTLYSYKYWYGNETPFSAKYTFPVNRKMCACIDENQFIFTKLY